MNNDNDYNGWANYETWNVTLWIGNDEGLYNFVVDGLTSLLEAHDYSWCDIPECEIRELVRDAFGSNKTPDGVSVLHPDLDWSEISDFLLEMAEGNNLQTTSEEI
jgi:hypothetical protein